jgi:hypothetical protein
MIALTFLGNDAAERLIDGLINHTIEHRWHSDTSERIGILIRVRNRL